MEGLPELHTTISCRRKDTWSACLWENVPCGQDSRSGVRLLGRCGPLVAQTHLRTRNVPLGLGTSFEIKLESEPLMWRGSAALNAIEVCHPITATPRRKCEPSSTTSCCERSPTGLIGQESRQVRGRARDQ